MFFHKIGPVRADANGAPPAVCYYMLYKKWLITFALKRDTIY